jgi:hypothetical protein
MVNGCVMVLHMNENEIKEFFEGLDFTHDDVKKVNSKAVSQARMGRDSGICSCGHPKSRHKYLDNRGHWNCEPSRMSCNCRNLEVVLEAQDTRDFLTKTLGNGAEHALSRGIDVTMKKGKWVKWVDTGRTCWVCKDPDKKTTIVAYKVVGEMPVECKGEGGQKNRMMCNECRESISRKGQVNSIE